MTSDNLGQRGVYHRVSHGERTREHALKSWQSFKLLSPTHASQLACWCMNDLHALLHVTLGSGPLGTTFRRWHSRPYHIVPS